MSQYIIIIHTHVIYAKYYNFVLRYGSKNVLLMVVNYMWKTDHLLQVKQNDFSLVIYDFT